MANYLFEGALAGLLAAGEAAGADGRALAGLLPDDAALEFEALAGPVLAFDAPLAFEAVFAAGVGGIAMRAPLSSFGLSITFWAR